MVNLEIKDISNFLNKKFKKMLASRDKNIIGLDIGLSSVKMLELKKKDSSYIVERYAETRLPEGVIIEDEIHDRTILIEIIQETYKKGKFSTSNVCFGLWGNNTIVRKIQIPAPDDGDDLYDHVLWEVEQYIPFDIDESYITYHELGVNEGGGIDLILAAAKKYNLEQFKKVIEDSGLFLKIIDHSAVSFANCFTEVFEIKEEGSIVLFEIGAQKSFFHIIKNGELNFYKELPIGGQMITEEIQRQMGVTYEEADDLKINGDGTGRVPEEVSVIIDEVLSIFSNDISEVLDFYKSSMSEESIPHFYITGRSAELAGCIDAIETKIKIPVTKLDLADNIFFSKAISEDDKKIFAISGFNVFGLALRQFDD